MKGSRPEQAALSRDTDLSRTDETRAVIEGMVDGLNDHRIADIGEFFADGFRWMGNFGCGTKTGLRAFQENWQRPFQAAFSDKICIDEARLFMGEWAAAFGRQEAAHSGEFMGVAPTGKRVEIRYMDFWKVVDGKIVDNWVMVDFPHVLNQLGVDVFDGRGWERFDRGDPAPVTAPASATAPDDPPAGPGWDQSADGWIASMGAEGDETRRFVLDAPMLSALPERGAALDIGCGEGRFCRMMAERGLTPTGIDPTEALLARARVLDPDGAYVQGVAEDLPFADAAFDVAVFYLSLIDIPDFRAAIAQAARVLRPGGRLLIGNLHAFMTARPRDWPGEGGHWVKERGERKHVAFDDMMVERSYVAAWGDIRIRNHHRPLSAYMEALLAAGLRLTRFEDPPWTGPDPARREHYKRAPWAFFMAWEKPE